MEPVFLKSGLSLSELIVTSPIAVTFLKGF